MPRQYKKLVIDSTDEDEVALIRNKTADKEKEGKAIEPGTPAPAPTSPSKAELAKAATEAPATELYKPIPIRKAPSDTSFYGSTYPPYSPASISASPSSPEYGGSTPSSPERKTTMYLLPNLTKPGYYTLPSRAELFRMSASQLKEVEDFTVGLENVGKVTWIDKTDIRGLDLDSIIEFRPGEVEVYPDETNKPPVGRGLNKPAVIVLENIFPKDRKTGQLKKDEDSLNRYRLKLMKSTERSGAKFIKYDTTTGDWVFEVEHFSRYGLLDDDSSEEEEAQPPPEEGVHEERRYPPASPGRYYAEEALDSDQEEGQYEEEEAIPSEGIIDEQVVEEEDEYLEEEEESLHRRHEEGIEGESMEDVDDHGVYHEPVYEEEEGAEEIEDEITIKTSRLPAQLGISASKMHQMKVRQPFIKNEDESSNICILVK